MSKYVITTINAKPAASELHSRLNSSNEKTLLFIPRSNLKSYGIRSFKYYGPNVWNSLRREIRDSDSLGHLNKDLKYYLFKIAFVL